MEFRRLIIAQKDSSTKYIFNNKVNLVTSTSLSDELLKANYDLTSSEFIIESMDNISIGDVFQIKVRVAKTGIMMLYFAKDALSEESKQNLFNEISALKDNAEVTEDAQKEKISRVIDIANKYSPIFICYANTGDFLFTKLTFEIILKDKEIDFPVLVLLTSLDFVDQPSTKQKKPLFQRKEGEPKPVKEKAEPKTKAGSILSMFKSLDFLFIGVFSLFVSLCLIISVFEIVNGEGIAAFLLILTIVYVGTLYYTSYTSSKDDKDFLSLKKVWVPAIYIILGIIIGTIIGWVITTYVIKLKEEVIINYAMLYGLCIPGSLVVCLLSLPASKLISKIIAKLKKNKE